jgi:hypothetical protein
MLWRLMPATMIEGAWSAERCASLLAKAKKTPNGWKACCPAHDDQNPSLFLADGESGVALVCYAGCDYRSIAQALETRGAILSTTNDPQTIPQEHFQLGPYHAHWDYRDVFGRVILRVCRWEQPGGKKDIRPLWRSPDGWKWAHHPTPRPLFQLDRLSADIAAPVLLVEGEKSAIAAQRLFPAYVASTWSGGAGAMGQTDSEPLASRDIVLVPDADTPGRKAMEWWQLHLKGSAKSVRVVDPRDFARNLPEGWDLADALAEGRDVSGWLIPPDPDAHRKRVRLDWKTLAGRDLPDREWAIDHWVPMGHVTLLSGAGGSGKSLVAQALGSCLTLQREYLDWIPRPRRVLLWACEDSHDEIWRRQVAIAQWLETPLSSFSGTLIAHSYESEQVDLAGLVDGRLEPATALIELREQIGDYKADVVILDNISRLYGGSENDRHQVTSFIALLAGAAAPTHAAVILLGHTAKMTGSEYSGSTAWETAVRARLYLARSLPGTAPDAQDMQGHMPIDDGVRYLCRRKSNYSDQDFRRLQYDSGVMKAEVPRETSAVRSRQTPEYVQEAVMVAMRKLESMGESMSSSKASPAFLPKLAERYDLLGNCTRSQFSQAMAQLQLSGVIVRRQIGQYPNRTPRFGLVPNVAQIKGTNNAQS